MKLYEIMINHKINRIQTGELLELARQYDVKLTSAQAEKICTLLNGKNVNLFDEAQRKKLVQQISLIAGQETAAKIEGIFNGLTGI